MRLLLVVLLAGCASPAVAVEDPPPEPRAPPANLDHALEWRYGNGGLPLLAPEVPIGSFELNETADLTVVVTRSSDNVRVFADNLRLYLDGRMQDQEAFSDQQVLNLFTTGTAEIHLPAAPPGHWHVMYVTDHVHPIEVHEGRTVATTA